MLVPGRHTLATIDIMPRAHIPLILPRSCSWVSLLFRSSLSTFLQKIQRSLHLYRNCFRWDLSSAVFLSRPWVSMGKQETRIDVSWRKTCKMNMKLSNQRGENPGPSLAIWCVCIALFYDKAWMCCLKLPGKSYQNTSSISLRRFCCSWTTREWIHWLYGVS